MVILTIFFKGTLLNRHIKRRAAPLSDIQDF